MARLQINCDFGIFVTNSTGHLGSTKNCAPSSDHHVRMRAFININSDLYQDHGGIIHGARGLNVNIALERPCCFSDSELVSAATASSSIALTIALLGLCGIESTTTMQNFVEF
jgi:hypothetical protein